MQKRNSFFKKIKDNLQNFGDQSSLHGVGHVFSASRIPFLKRFFWFLVVILCCLGTSRILRSVTGLYSEGAVSYSVETNYLNWDTPFPAVTICEQMNPERIKAYFMRHKVPITLMNFYKEVIFWNNKYCKTCISCKMNQTCVENFLEAAFDVRMQCSELLSDCWWDDKYFPCCDRFKRFETEYGHCFVFNSRLTAVTDKSSILTVNRRVGLPKLVFSAHETVSVRVHSPDDVVSVAIENVLGRSGIIPMISDYEAVLKVEETISDTSLDSVTPSMRGCLFKHERPASSELWPYESYTYSACIMYCRSVAQIDFCNCTHHFMPKLRNIAICDVQGLGCLHKNKDGMANLKCECPMACDETLYKLVHVFSHRHLGNLPDELTRRGSRGVIHLAQLPDLRVRRHAIRDMLSLVVDIGGVVGVFFGASLLSLIEIIYLFCIRRRL